VYRSIEESLITPIGANNAVNATQHVWRYVKDKETESEKKRFRG
jgi:hypothetical protein